MAGVLSGPGDGGTVFELTDVVLGAFLILIFLVGVGLLVRDAMEKPRPQRSVGYRRSRRRRLRFKKSVDKSGLVRYSREADGGVGVIGSPYAPIWSDPEYGGTPDQVAVIGLAWALTEDTHRYVLPVWNWKNAASAAGALTVEHVRWEYTDGGFTEAKSWDPTDPLDRWPWYRQLDYTGLFRVESLSQLAQVVNKLAEEHKRVSLFGLNEESRFVDVVHRLNGQTRPELPDLIETGEWFIDLFWGVDINIDRFLIATQSGGEARFETVLAETRDRIAEYERTLKTGDNTLDGSAALARLQGRT